MHIIAIIGQILFGAYWLQNSYNHFRNINALSGYAGSKGVPQPKLAVGVTGALLLIGGLGIILGAYVQWAILALVIFLIPTTLMMHDFWKSADPMDKMGQRVQFMKNIALLAALLMMWSLPVLAYSLF